MLKVIEKHKERLSSFLAQRRDLLLVVHASDADAVFLLQFATELDEASGEDLFIILGGEFHDPDSYALSVAETFVAQHALAAEAVKKAGKPALPPAPPGLLAPARPGHERLRDLVAFSHELLPAEARRLVVVLGPLEIAERAPYLALVAALLPRPEREPWMSRLRLIVRDVGADQLPMEREHPLASKTSAHLSSHQIDFGPVAIRKNFEETAQDESVPVAQRMDALLSSAILDGTYGERPKAVEKLLRVFAYAEGEKNLVMQAVAANSVGEVCEGGESLVRAQEWYECALRPALASSNAIIVATVVQNLGKLCYLRGDFASAAQYFDGLAQLAPKILDNETMSYALEQRGASEAALGKSAEAIQTWRQGADLCRNTDHTPGLKKHLTRLSEAYARAGMPGDQRTVESELSSLGNEAGHA